MCLTCIVHALNENPTVRRVRARIMGLAPAHNYVAQVSNRFPTCCVADFQSAVPRIFRMRPTFSKLGRLEALRYSPDSSGETCATLNTHLFHCKVQSWI